MEAGRLFLLKCTLISILARVKVGGLPIHFRDYQICVETVSFVLGAVA